MSESRPSPWLFSEDVALNGLKFLLTAFSVVDYIVRTPDALEDDPPPPQPAMSVAVITAPTANSEIFGRGITAVNTDTS